MSQMSSNFLLFPEKEAKSVVTASQNISYSIGLFFFFFVDGLSCVSQKINIYIIPTLGEEADPGGLPGMI
jgi:hypothetical protein